MFQNREHHNPRTRLYSRVSRRSNLLGPHLSLCPQIHENIVQVCALLDLKPKPACHHTQLFQLHAAQTKTALAFPQHNVHYTTPLSIVCWIARPADATALSLTAPLKETLRRQRGGNLLSWRLEGQLQNPIWNHTRQFIFHEVTIVFPHLIFQPCW